MMEVFIVPFIGIMLSYYFILLSPIFDVQSSPPSLLKLSLPTKAINIHYVDATANSSHYLVFPVLKS